MAHNMNLETARKILIDILKAIALPENSKKLSDAKLLSGKETVKFFQQVFPLVMEIQMNVVSNYGFTGGREGLIQFEQLIRELETSDPEIARLREQIRGSYLPPMNSTSPDVLI